MNPAESAIARLRRDLTLSSVLRFVLFAGALACIFLETLPFRSIVSGSLALAVIGSIWLFLSYRSIRGSQMAAASPALIAAGDLEQAERHIEEALHSFSLFRSAKLRSLHHLLMLRHAQRRFAESALLAREMLGQRLGALRPLSRSTRLVLADSLLEVGDLRGAYEAIGQLYGERLTLAEGLELTLVQLEYEARIGAWAQMLQGAARKAELAELLPASKAARANALLALAAKKTGQAESEHWLRRRAELLCDVQELVTRRPLLRELWLAA